MENKPILKKGDGFVEFLQEVRLPSLKLKNNKSNPKKGEIGEMINVKGDIKVCISTEPLKWKKIK